MSKRISKMLFSKEKVELSAINDLKKSSSNLEKLNKKLEKGFADFKEIRREIQGYAAGGIELQKQIEIFIQDLEKMAKELGVNASDIPEIKEANKIFVEFEKNSKRADDIVKVRP